LFVLFHQPTVVIPAATAAAIPDGLGANEVCPTTSSELPVLKNQALFRAHSEKPHAGLHDQLLVVRRNVCKRTKYGSGCGFGRAHSSATTKHLCSIKPSSPKTRQNISALSRGAFVTQARWTPCLGISESQRTDLEALTP